MEGKELNEKELDELKTWLHATTKDHLGLKEGDPKDLTKSGWGVIFPENVDPAIPQALKELLDWRQEQVSQQYPHYYREFSGKDGYQAGDTKLGWLARQKMGPGPADPSERQSAAGRCRARRTPGRGAEPAGTRRACRSVEHTGRRLPGCRRDVLRKNEELYRRLA